MAAAEPVQYCRFDSLQSAERQVDFCVGTLMYHNTTTNGYDMYMTMTVRRHEGLATGWTAVGTGAVMQGSLMFVVYGDPLGEEQPIISIRTADGHHQPRLLTHTDMPHGMDLRVLSSAWQRGDSLRQHQTSEGHTARISIICYSCHLWSGSAVSAQSRSQPWIWAWNADQDFDVFAFDAHLKMHKHHIGTGGWGNFYLDMRRSINTAVMPPSLPPVRSDIAMVGASDMPMSLSGTVVSTIWGPTSFGHGLAMASAFLFIFPIGVIGLRSGFSQSFRYHWIIQICASVTLLAGLALGLLKARRISTAHQCVGISLVVMVGVQGLLGWWHHRNYVRLQRRTWISHAHLWLGRIFMLAGWGNVIGGLILRGYRKNSAMVIATTIVVCLQAIGLSTWTMWQRKPKISYAPKPQWAKADEDTFTLSASDEEDNDAAAEMSSLFLRRESLTLDEK